MLYFAGSGLADIKKAWQVEWGKVKISKFANGERRVQIGSRVKGQRAVVVVRMVGEAVDERWIEAMLMGDALRGEGARRVKLVMLFMGYSLMSRKFAGEPRSAEVVGKTLSMFFDEVEVWEVHDEGVSKFFRVPFYNRPILWEMANILKDDARLQSDKQEWVMVAPDQGSAVRARQVGDVWGIERVWVGEKVRDVVSTQIEKLALHPYRGEKRLVRGVKKAVIVDDMVNTGGTVVRVGESLRKRGVEEIGLMVAHWLPVAGNWEKVRKVVDWVVVSNSVAREKVRHNVQLEVIKIKEGVCAGK